MKFFAIALLCLILFPHHSSELRLEISLKDRSGPIVKVKIMCEPVGKKIQNSKEEDIWSQGLKFRNKERNNLHQKIHEEIFFPNIRVNSTNGYRCFLTPPISNIDKDHLRKRIHREIAASVPAEFGNCSPGYRLHQDKCFPCPPGTFTSGQETNCNLCPRNFFNSKEAADSCNPCPEAKKTLADGADTEDLCVYLDTAGRPVTTFSTKLLVLGICATIFIVAAWIVIGLYLYWWCREKRLKRTTDDETWWNFRHLWKTLFKKKEKKDSTEEHIYAEIGEDNTYIDILSDDDGYEVPRKPGDNDGYEVPKKPDKDNEYIEILPDDDGYEVPKKPSYDDHIYESIKEPKDYNVHDQPKNVTSNSRENKSSSNKIQAIDNDFYYVNKDSGMIIRKTSRSKEDDTRNLLNDSFDQLYADADTTPTAREHRGHIPKTESYGFQPLLSSEEEEGGRLAVKKSDYNQLAKIILKTSKSESDARAGNQVPNLEELGYDVEKLSKVMEKISEKSRLDDQASDERLEVPSRSRIAQERRFSEDVSKLSQTTVLKNVLKDEKFQETSLRAEDFGFKSRNEKDGRNEKSVRKSSTRVAPEFKAQKSSSLPHRSISKTVSKQSDVSADIEGEN